MKRPRAPPKEREGKNEGSLHGYSKRIPERIRRRNGRYAQAAAGVAMLLFTVPTIIVLDGDTTIGVFTVPLALYLIFGSEMVIVNGYFRETKERR